MALMIAFLSFAERELCIDASILEPPWVSIAKAIGVNKEIHPAVIKNLRKFMAYPPILRLVCNANLRFTLHLP
jgi:hypothetical protein